MARITNLPDDVQENDPRAPWNQPPDEETCETCEGEGHIESEKYTGECPDCGGSGKEKEEDFEPDCEPDDFDESAWEEQYLKENNY